MACGGYDSNSGYLADAGSLLLFEEPEGAPTRPTRSINREEELKKQAEEQRIEIKRLKEKYKERIQILDQVLRCNTLRIYGAEERVDEDPFEVVLRVLRENLRMTIRLSDLRSCYRCGNTFPRPIIVRFTTSAITEQVLRRKSILKGSRIGISEELGPDTRRLFNRVSNHFQRRNVWIERGVVKVSLPDQTQRRFDTESEFDNYLKEEGDKPLIDLLD